jgi:hypothetical protein
LATFQVRSQQDIIGSEQLPAGTGVPAGPLTAVTNDEANDEAVAELGTGILPPATLLREQKNWYDDPVQATCIDESDEHRKEVLHAFGPFMQSSADL